MKYAVMLCLLGIGADTFAMNGHYRKRGGHFISVVSAEVSTSLWGNMPGGQR